MPGLLFHLSPPPLRRLALLLGALPPHDLHLRLANGGFRRRPGGFSNLDGHQILSGIQESPGLG